jgi:carbohydrate kinase (thermoresistant glucokinase family)
MVLVVSGVAASGKTTVGKMLAERLGLPYADADEFHPKENLRKMSAGQPLTDNDRVPWLDAIARWIDERLAAGESAVVTASALKKAYREKTCRPGVCFVFLKVSLEVARERLARRQGHFFPAALAASQFEVLEEPTPDEPVIVVDADQPPQEVVEQILKAARLKAG